MISDMCLADIVERSGLTSFFKVENTRSLELDEAGVAKILKATLNNVGYIDFLEYQNCTTENGLDRNDSWIKPNCTSFVDLYRLTSSVSVP